MTRDGRSDAFDAIAEAKRLLRSIRSGSLATLTPDGAPFASLVAVATMPDGAPVVLLSQLAAHTRHLAADPRCSLLLPEGGKGDPLAHPRLTLVGQASRAETKSAEARRRFLARNPKSALYADFPDFSFWVVEVASAHLNGGFARAATLARDEILGSLAGCEDLVAGEADAIAHMNADHQEAIGLYATVLAGLPAGDWRLSGLDPEGLDLVWGDRTGRVPFANPIASLRELRATLVTMANKAREP